MHYIFSKLLRQIFNFFPNLSTASPSGVWIDGLTNTKMKLDSTQVEVEVKVRVVLGKKFTNFLPL